MVDLTQRAMPLSPGSKTDRNVVVLVALKAPRFPLIGESHGVSAIAGYLNKSFPGINVDVLDCQLVDVDHIVTLIEKKRPAILGISVKQQTFNELLSLRQRLRMQAETRPLLILGNSVPMLSPHAVLQRVPEAVVGQGEGEIVISDLYRHLRGELDWNQVRNLAFWAGGELVFRERHYLKASSVAAPYRGNSLDFYHRGGEVYVEASRGCAYGMCSFCSCSNLLGSRLQKTKWRPRPIDRVLEDMATLERLHIKEVTFSDEDFFGIGDEGIARATRLAEEMIAQPTGVSFRVNAWVKSVFSRGDTAQKVRRKEEAIARLHQAGLLKLFLGLESGSESQLARYRKGFVLSEFKTALSLLQRHGIECEFGFILLDPLMTFGELGESLLFLRENGFVHQISSVFKELRVQVGNSYVEQVREVEQRLGARLLGELELDSQEYPVLDYLSQRVQFFALNVRPWVSLIYGLHYALRIGTQYSLGAYGDDGRRAMRDPMFAAIRSLRSLEYRCLKNMYRLIEERGIDSLAASSLLSRLEDERRALVMELRNRFQVGGDSKEIAAVRDEVEGYLGASERYLRKVGG